MKIKDTDGNSPTAQKVKQFLVFAKSNPNEILDFDKDR